MEIKFRIKLKGYDEFYYFGEPFIIDFKPILEEETELRIMGAVIEKPKIQPAEPIIRFAWYNSDGTVKLVGFESEDQYIGHTDSFDKEIYVHDIVEVTYNNDDSYVFLCLIEDIRKLPSEMFGSNVKSRRIIGNKWQNPDLWNWGKKECEKGESKKK